MDEVFGAQLRSLRLERGLSQVALAVMVETNPTHICAYETGKSEPKVPMVRRLAEALAVPASALLEERKEC